MVWVVGGRGFVDVDVGRSIVVVYGEGVVEVGLGVELGLMGGSYEEEKKSRRKW